MRRLHETIKLGFRSLLTDRPDLHTREILRGAGAGFFLRITGAVFAFLFTVVLARSLGAEAAGIYYLAFTVTFVAGVIGRVGLELASLRFVAAHAAMGEWEAVNGVYGQAVRISLLASGVCAVATALGAPFIARGLFAEPSLTEPLRWMSLVVVPTSLIAIHGEMLKGVRRPKEAMFVQASGVSVLSFPLLLAVGSGWGIFGPVFAFSLASGVITIFGVFFWRRATPMARGIRGRFNRRLLLSTSSPLLLVAIMDLVMRYSDVVVLGVFADTSDVGVYSAATRTAMLTSFILIAVNSVVAPKMAALHHQGEHVTLETVARNAARMTLILATPMLLVFLLFPGRVLGFFGDSFEAGAPALAILATGQFVNVATGSVRELLVMSGHERLVRNNFLGAAVLNVGLSLLLVPPFGIVGAAMATATSVAAMNVVAVFLVYWKLGIVSVAFVRR